MEFSLGRDTLPSQARSVRGESRRLRRERDIAYSDIRSGGSPSVIAPGHNATRIQRKLANRR